MDILLPRRYRRAAHELIACMTKIIPKRRTMLTASARAAYDPSASGILNPLASSMSASAESWARRTKCRAEGDTRVTIYEPGGHAGPSGARVPRRSLTVVANRDASATGRIGVGAAAIAVAAAGGAVADIAAPVPVSPVAGPPRTAVAGARRAAVTLA